jgi:hypothetical protein
MVELCEHEQHHDQSPFVAHSTPSIVLLIIWHTLVILPKVSVESILLLPSFKAAYKTEWRFQAYIVQLSTIYK